MGARSLHQSQDTSPDSTVDKPARWLAGYATVHAGAGETVPVIITLPARRFAHWADGAWQTEPGTYLVQVGTSVDELLYKTEITVD